MKRKLVKIRYKIQKKKCDQKLTMQREKTQIKKNNTNGTEYIYIYMQTELTVETDYRGSIKHRCKVLATIFLLPL